MKNFCENIQAVFHIADKYTKTHLPFQIFVNREFKFLITSGGAFVDNKNEYIKFSSVLNTIGEEYICLLEHIDNQYASDSPFKGVIKTCEGFDAFRRLETTFDPHFGLILSNFYIFGANPNWGIYLCEYPAIKLIVCIDRYIPAYKHDLNIRGTGFDEEEPLIEQEFGQNRNFQDKLIENYHL